MRKRRAHPPSLFLLAIVFLLASASLSKGQIVDSPGWFAYKGERIAPGENRWGEPSRSPAAMPLSGMRSGAAPDSIHPEIEELARNLQYDPRLIFQFVHNKIDYVPYFGFMKGARQTLLERAGNDADIAALLAALLRASGFDAEYVYGVQQIPTAGASCFTAARWLDVEDAPTAVDRALRDNGIPGAVDATWTWVDRIWVASEIDGVVRQLDAGFKPRDRGTPFDLAAVMGYDRSTLLNAAGGVVGSYDVRSLNEAALTNRLAIWAGQLAAAFRGEHVGVELDEALGKSRIHELDFEELPTSLRFAAVVPDRADPLARPLMETDASGAPVRTWLWANGALLAQIESDGAVRYAHFNELGHLIALTDAAGALTDQFA